MKPPDYIYKLLLLFFVCLLTSKILHAQYDEENFIHYTVRNGMSENYITDIHQDDWGYIWIGTENGLNRFDGYTFKKYFQGMMPLPLLSNGIRSLKKFGDHRLGIITQNGFQLLNTKNLAVTDYAVPGKPEFSIHRNGVWDVKSLPEYGFLLTTSTGIYAFDKNRQLKYRFDAFTEKDALTTRMYYGREILQLKPADYFIYLRKDKYGYYHAGTNRYRELSENDTTYSIFQALNRNVEPWTKKIQISADEYIFLTRMLDSIVYYHHTTKKIAVSALPKNFGTNFTWESSHVMLNDSVLLISHHTNGFYLFNINRHTGRIHCNTERLLSAYKINCLFADKSGRLWVGTTRGVLSQKLKPKLLTSYSFGQHLPDSISGYINCGFRYKNKFYAGLFSRTMGLMILDTATMAVEKKISFYGKDSKWNEVRTLQMYHPDTLWLSTNNGILWFDVKTQHYGKLSDSKNYSDYRNTIWILTPPGPDGYAWISSMLSGIVARYHIASRTSAFFTTDSKPALPFGKTKHITYDANGDVWIGGHALARWNNKKQLFDTLITVYAGLNKYNDDILVMSADAYGSLWMHNAYNGLLEYNVNKKIFSPYGMADGLPSLELRCLSPVVQDILWLGSNNYLTKFDIKTKKAVVYNYKDGLPDQRPAGRQIYFDKQAGLYYLFFKNMIARFPLNQNHITPDSQPLLIEEIMVNNRKNDFFPDGEMRFRSNAQNLTLFFTLIDFEKGDDYSFFYKLNNAETWTDAGNQRSINLTGLPSGFYTLEIKSITPTGEVKQKRFIFSIAPPFWKTGWFLAASAFFIVSLAYLLYRWRLKQVRQKANLDKLLVQTEMKALHAQMNPHFIFNCLNRIREMILNSENREASHYLSKFAQLIRITLNQSSMSFVSLQHTFDYLERYLEMEAIRNHKFTYNIEVDAQLQPEEIMIPPMMIQPFIENAIWHGAPAGNKINILIRFLQQDHQLVCLVEDNGVGIETSLKNTKDRLAVHHSFGIANIKERIRVLNEKYHLQSRLSIEDKSNLAPENGTGTVVKLYFPLS